MKKLFFILLCTFSISFSMMGQNSQSEDMKEGMDQMFQEMEKLVQEFEKMPGFTQMWMDTLMFDDQQLQQLQDGFKDINPETMSMGDMMDQMQKMMEQFAGEIGPKFESLDNMEWPKSPSDSKEEKADPKPKAKPQMKIKTRKKKSYTM